MLRERCALWVFGSPCDLQGASRPRLTDYQQFGPRLATRHRVLLQQNIVEHEPDQHCSGRKRYRARDEPEGRVRSGTVRTRCGYRNTGL